MRLYVNCEDNEITYNKKNYLVAAEKRLGLDIIRNWDPLVDRPEFVLNIQPYGLLRTGTKWTGAWWIDTLLDNPKFESEYPSITTIFLAGSSHKIIPRDNHKLLFQAADTDIHKPMPVEKDCDFILAGSMGLAIYEEREKLINKMRNEFTYVGAGKGFKPVEYVKQLNRARVQFIRSMDVDGKGEIAQRFFECLAIGPVLTNWVDDLAHTGLVEWQDYVAYKTDEEAVSKMRFLLKHPEDAQKIAENGRYKSNLYHTYEHRLITIINECKKYDTETR